jgi:hypothetical protein
LGDVNLNESIIDDAKPEEHEIKRFILHPEYNLRKKQNDIALIELNATVEFSKSNRNLDFIRPACLQQDENFSKTMIAVS